MAQRITRGSFAALGILLLILDTRTALAGARDGITLCINSVVPSIFPFLVLSGILTSTILGANLKILYPLGRLVGIPNGMEGIFLTGILAGYPVGAQSVHHAWEQKQLSTETARRMLAFCSNAGPSFLFGILSMQFSSPGSLWVLWGIHVLSAIMVGALLPGKSKKTKIINQSAPVTLPQALKKAVVTMGMICGWIILFRVILAFWDRWLLWRLPTPAQVTVHGILELANGCCNLSQISPQGLRFVLASSMLSFGGICVLLQTVSVTDKLGIGQYLIGKLLQTALSLILSVIMQNFLFSPADRLHISVIGMLFPVLFCIVIIAFYRKIEKKSSIPAMVGV